jgi:Uma2 family endonuclease
VIGEVLRDRAAFRLTFDRGTLEIMVLGPPHERYKILMGLLVFALAEELNKLIGGFGSFTHQREDLARGLEPDQCYYLANFKAVKGKKETDLTADPPPDLAIEIEVSRSVLDRLAIYAALGVPEVWRFDGKNLTVCLLVEGRYEQAETSPTFPEIPIGELARFVRLGQEEGDLGMVRHFRKWLRGQTRGKKSAKRKKQ